MVRSPHVVELFRRSIMTVQGILRQTIPVNWRPGIPLVYIIRDGAM